MRCFRDATYTMEETSNTPIQSQEDNQCQEQESYALNCDVSPDDERDWVYDGPSVATTKSSSRFSFLRKKKESTQIRIPTVVDYRPYLRPVRNQGNQGSCVAQVGACMKEWQESNDCELDTYMSPQYIYNLRQNTSTSGMYPRNAMALLRTKGCCLESVFPYGSTQVPAENIQEHAKTFKIASYARCMTLDSVKIALAIHGPCLLCVPVYHHGKNMWKPKKRGDRVIGYHAMTLVGYNSSGFLVRNSWGTKWGDKGYTHFPYVDWGYHREIWTCVDEKGSVHPFASRRTYWQRMWDKWVSWMTHLRENRWKPSLR